MYDFTESIKDAIVALAVGICGKKLYRSMKKWWYSDEDIDINDFHIEFVPQITEEEKIIVTRKGKNPEIFKYFSDVK